MKARREERRKLVTAVAVREQGSQRHCNIVRFLYAVPASISEALKKWEMVPRRLETDREGLFVAGGETYPQWAKIEEDLLPRCTVLTISQRSVDWLVL